MASEQTGARKKQSRNTSRENQHHPVLYRHQDCIPNSKSLQNCERHGYLGLKTNQDYESCGKVVSEQETYLKNSNTRLNSRVKNEEKCEKNLQEIKFNPHQSNGTFGNNEELSKSRKRRLRKRRLLVALAPSISEAKPNPSVESGQHNSDTQAVSHHSSVSSPAPLTLINRSSDPSKTSVKDSRKRTEKNLSSRNKSIKSKSMLDSSNQSKADIIKTLEEKTLNSLLQTLVPLSNSSPKKEKPAVPLFSFPEKRLNSSDTKVDKDGVFYFGETKHQLERLSSSFDKYSPNSSIHEKSEFAQNTELKNNCFSPSKLSNLENCISALNFSPLSSDRLSPSLNLKQNLFGTESTLQVNKFENSGIFPVAPSNYKTKELVLKSPVLNPLPSDLNSLLNISESSVSNTALREDSNSSDLSEINAVKATANIVEIGENLQIISGTNKSVLEKEFKTSETSDINSVNCIKSNPSVKKSANEMDKSNKSREEIIAEREAKKAAKLAAKSKHKTAQLIKVEISKNDTLQVESTVIARNNKCTKSQDIKTVEGILLPSQELENKVINNKATTNIISKATPEKDISGKGKEIVGDGQEDSSAKTKADLRAERRAKQEAQRAAKAAGKSLQPQHKDKVTSQVKTEQIKTPNNTGQPEKKSEVGKVSAQPKPKLFSHLHQEKIPVTSDHILKVGGLHPAIVRLGLQYASRVVLGSNARCVALLHALKQMVNDYTTPPEKEFSRGLEEELGPVTVYLNQSRPLAVSMTNALRHIKRTLTQLPNNIPDVEARRKICDMIDTYIHEQIDVAGKAICNTVKKKIANGDVILIYGCSSLLYKILVESHLSGTKFRVVVVDGLPWREGKEMLRRLVEQGLSCTYVLITAASFIMREATKVLLGAHALLANGYVMSRAGSSQVALLAHCYNVPVLVCCETHKFCERVQTDAFVYNELGELCCDDIKDKEKGRMVTSLTPLSLAYDITPPDLVSAVVTELAVLPCTSVPVILRIKPSESVM